MFPHIFLASFVLSFLVAFEVPRICNWLQLIAKCIGLKIEDWRFSEKLLQSRSGLKIEDSQKNFFNPGLASHLQSRIGLKKFFWESSIFNPGLGTYIDRWCSGTNQSTAWIATSQTNLPGCRTSPVDLAKPWEHLKPTCFAAARTSNMSLHTSGHIVAPKSGLFACHHASKADSTLSTSQPVP